MFSVKVIEYGISFFIGFIIGGSISYYLCDEERGIYFWIVSVATGIISDLILREYSKYKTRKNPLKAEFVLYESGEKKIYVSDDLEYKTTGSGSSFTFKVERKQSGEEPRKDQ